MAKTSIWVKGASLSVIVIALMLVVGAFSGTFSTTGGQQQTTTTVGGETGDYCSSATSPAGKLTLSDALDADASKLTHMVKYRKDGGSTSAFQESMTDTDISFTAREAYEYLTNSTGEYKSYGVRTIPCAEVVDWDAKAYDMATVSSMTAYAENQQGKRTEEENISVSAGGTTTFTWFVQGQSEDSYGNQLAKELSTTYSRLVNPYNCQNVLLVDAVTNNWKEVRVDEIRNGAKKTLLPAYQPSIYSVSSTSNKVWSFYTDPIVGTDRVQYQITFDGTGKTDDPIENATAVIIDVDLVTDAMNRVVCGVQSSSNADVGVTGGHLNDTLFII